ncbi:hypothetical protein BDY19DRAFT_994340 [Irpex rosettiformis]|uniref:Uncharacterized protein n=2 Tax=Irpex rosettiformis TaxID=378272 RepID=A0ACB8TM58_9APHY|nr:hypothetical protein BDY19DRAFT_998875 [Irpex rosettiformis]KAI0088452.1 hypothetical protein BDY19DRAFT_994340 [Irpex rosettiformis]
MEKLDAGTLVTKIKFDVKVGVLRNCSVEWLVNSYNAINNPDLVKKAWEMCRVPKTTFNLSHESLDKITSGKSEQSVIGEAEEAKEDMGKPWELGEGEDNVNVSMKTVITRTMAQEIDDVSSNVDDSETEDDKDLDEDYAPSMHITQHSQTSKEQSQELGDFEPMVVRGKRVRVPNKHYDDASWTHFDASDDEYN